MVTTTLTEEQENFVWNYICWNMNDEDRDPLEVIKDNYKGDRHRYLEDMADWLCIRFCRLCGRVVVSNDGKIDLCDLHEN